MVFTNVHFSWKRKRVVTNKRCAITNLSRSKNIFLDFQNLLIRLENVPSTFEPVTCATYNFFFLQAVYIFTFTEIDCRRIFCLMIVPIEFIAVI